MYKGIIRNNKRKFISAALMSALFTTASSASEVLFADDFEQNNLTNSSWEISQRGQVLPMANAGFESRTAARLKLRGYMEKTVSTVGFHSVTLDYVRKMALGSSIQMGRFSEAPRPSFNSQGSNSPVKGGMSVKWSIDGIEWHLLDTSEVASWQATTVALPKEANNQEQVTLRFSIDAHSAAATTYLDNISITANKTVINPNVIEAKWQHENLTTVTLASAAQTSGLYALADSANNAIEIRDVRQDLQHNISNDVIDNTLANLNIFAEYNICSMTLTPSGRQLFIGICSQDENDNSDLILAYNLNTKQLDIFAQLTISQTQSKTNYGLAYFKGELFVGTDAGVYRYQAGRNALADNELNAPFALLTPSNRLAVNGLAINMIEQELYLSTENTVYKLDLSNTEAELAQLTTGDNFKAISYGRTYGGESTHGLYVLRNDNNIASMLAISSDELKANLEPSLIHYSDFITDVTDISATADGKILLAANHAVLISDSTDNHLSFDDWLVDELNQYVAAIKSVSGSASLTGTNALIPEGFLARKIVSENKNQNLTPIADNVGWALFLLMSADQVSPDAEIESLIELLIQRHAGLHPDLKGGIKTIDGHFLRNYLNDGSPNEANPQYQVYTSMKFIPAVYKAAEFYPDNKNIQLYKEYLRQTMKRASDTIQAEQRITWQNDNYGPFPTNNRMTNETWIYGDLGAAQDPMATQDYDQYVYRRTNMNYDHWLKGEPVILASHSAFIIMGGSMILKHHFDDADWSQQNRNYYAVTMAASDELGAPYFAAFSAGNNPYNGSSYYNDGPSDHPGDVIHFPAVLGLGQLGWTSPMVGGYQAYRDGRRQAMLNGADGSSLSMLTRWSNQDASYSMDSVGIADFWYGAMGLVETIKPGTLDTIRDEFYRPQLEQALLSNGNTELHYSKITPRRVIATTDSGDEHSFGFQLSPFEVPNSSEFSQFEVLDPEGELLELNQIFVNNAPFVNPDFEQGITGWSTFGDYKFYQPQVDGVSIVGRSAEVRTVPSSTSQTSGLSQTLDLSVDLTKTRYIIRANGAIATSEPTGNGYLRIRWDNDADESNGFSSELISNQVSNTESTTEFLLNAQKPANTSFLHIAFVVEAVEAKYQRFIFDNLSVVRLGAKMSLFNGNFEKGTNAWKNISSTVTLTTDPDKVLEGTQSLSFVVGAGVTSWKSATRNLSVTNDPLGTRYIFRLDAKAIRMTDSDFEIYIETYDIEGNKIITRNDIGDILPSTDGEINFTFRKRPGDASYKIVFRMRRNSKASTGTDEVIIDNLRLDKEQLF